MKRVFSILSISIVLLIALTNTSMAVIADSKPVTITQPNGTVLTIIQYGDEFFHWASTTDGYTLIQNEQGIFEYAILDGDENLIGSGIPAVDVDQRKSVNSALLAGIKKGLRFSSNQIEQKRKNSPLYMPSAKRGSFPTTGENKLLMILGNFADTDTTYSQQDFKDYMNKEGGVTGKGSFKDYYTEVSYDQLTMTTIVSVWVTVPNGHDYYGPDSKWAEFAYDAIAAADETGLDFSQFDNDGDGEVDGIAVIHQGKGQEATGDETDIWSHSWNIKYAGYTTSDRTFDGVQVGAYTLQPERYGSGMSTIGVMCHEFGHNLGAPDYYDTDYDEGGSYSGTGRWDLMAGGSWNGSPGGSTPAHPNMFQKIAFGWLQKTEITENELITLNPSERNKEAYFYKTPTSGEYFLFENRQRIGFDAAIPGHGLIIYHVDENYINSHSGNNNINAGAHQGLYPKAANGNINSAGCPFPGTSQVTEFTDYTNPNSIAWSGEFTSKPIMNIQETDTVITFQAFGKEIEEITWNLPTPGSDSLGLSWKNNALNDTILLVWSQNNEFSKPDIRTIYQPGDTLPGGEEVLYYGDSDSLHVHKNLIPGISYYYKIFVYSNGFYSKGVTQQNTTSCFEFYETPYFEGFEHFKGSDPGLCWSIMRNNVNNGLNGDSLEVVSKEFNDETWFVNTTAMEDGYVFVNSGEQSMYIGSEATDYNWLISPSVKLPDGYADLTFFAYYVTVVKKVSFNVMLNIDGVWLNLLEWYNNPTNEYSEAVTLNLDTYAGQIVRFAFVYKGENSFRMALDDISVTGGEGVRPYDITYHITDKGEPVKEATIVFNEMEQVTDSLGYTTFFDIVPAENINYSISKDGFNLREDELNVTDKDTTISIELWRVDVDEEMGMIGKVYPNPAKDVLHIQSYGESAIYEFYSLTGKMLKTGSLGRGENLISLDGITSGIYIVKVSAENNNIFERIIIE